MKTKGRRDGFGGRRVARLSESPPKKNARAVVLFEEAPGRLLGRRLAALKDSRGEGG